jgi:hypothetical protein
VPRILVIHREAAEAAALAGRLRDRGLQAEPYLSLGSKGFREIRANPPDVILIDLIRLPSYGKAIGALLRESKALCTIPLVFIAGDPQKTAAVKRILPDAIYAPWLDVPAAVQRALELPAKPPKLPRSSGRSVAQKLGIEANSSLALLNSPGDFALDLPEGVRTAKRPADADVVLLWARNEAVLDRELPAIVKLMGKGRRVWLLWPKRTSGVETNLTMPRVREVVIAYGLIDYKVCAVDATWSGMAVGLRRR